MILKDCKIGDIVWVWNYVFNKYVQVQILETKTVSDTKYLMPDVVVYCTPITTSDLADWRTFSVTQECWKECPKEKPKLKYHTTFRELWDRFEWPDYQEYQDKPGFDDNSVYDAENNTYFIKVNWLKLL